MLDFDWLKATLLLVSLTALQRLLMACCCLKKKNKENQSSGRQNTPAISQNKYPGTDQKKTSGSTKNRTSDKSWKDEKGIEEQIFEQLTPRYLEPQVSRSRLEKMEHSCLKVERKDPLYRTLKNIISDWGSTESYEGPKDHRPRRRGRRRQRRKRKIILDRTQRSQEDYPENSADRIPNAPRPQEEKKRSPDSEKANVKKEQNIKHPSSDYLF